MTEQKTTKVFQGVVASAKMNKTIVVQVDRMKKHPKYGKQYRASTKFHVHDEKGEYKVGDTVRFVETRPLSKTKRWRAVEKVTAK
jgi:small subunit ribosomal protein S17